MGSCYTILYQINFGFTWPYCFDLIKIPPAHFINGEQRLDICGGAISQGFI